MEIVLYDLSKQTQEWVQIPDSDRETRRFSMNVSCSSGDVRIQPLSFREEFKATVSKTV